MYEKADQKEDVSIKQFLRAFGKSGTCEQWQTVHAFVVLNWALDERTELASSYFVPCMWIRLGSSNRTRCISAPSLLPKYSHLLS